MKKHMQYIILGAIIFWLVTILAIMARGREVKFQWDEYAGTNGLSSNMVYRLYSTTNVGSTAGSWKVIGTVTNKTDVIVDIGTGDNVVICAVTVSNDLFESSFSVPLSLPEKPVWQGGTNSSLRYQVYPK